MFIENEGALFKGPSRGNPTHVWSRKTRSWKPYAGGPKPIEWGSEISEAEAREMMGVGEERNAAE
jgi:hypothetical protein